MGLADISVPKTNPDWGTLYGGVDEPVFQSIDLFLKEKLSQISAKALLVFDADRPFFREAATSPRAIAAVYDGDCLPLFSMPDGISCVIAAGKSELLHAARYFSEVRGICCTLFPLESTLSGAFERRAKVKLNGENLFVSLNASQVVLDEELLKDTALCGYLQTLLSRLSVIEAEALSLFRGGREKFPEAEIPKDLSLKEILLANARQRMKESRGAPTGEGVILAELKKKAGEKYPLWGAYFELCALYCSFFEKGKPRRYFTPDYAARALKANTPYPIPCLPTPETYALRALTLERVRGTLAKQVLSLMGDGEIYKNACALAGEKLPKKAENLQPLSVLPEHAPYGLAAIIRDFGLMEGL